MVRLIGLPRSLWQSVKQLFSGSLGDVLWKLFLSVLFLVVIVVLASMGLFGGLIAAALFGALLSDEIRGVVSDVWHRRWAEIELPFVS